MRILIIDDSEIIRKSLQRFLEPNFQEAEYRHADNAKQAGELCREFDPQFITLDIHMPGTSGLDFLKALRAGGNDVPILVVSADEDRRGLEQALLHGATSFLSKPYTSISVATAVDKLRAFFPTEK